MTSRDPRVRRVALATPRRLQNNINDAGSRGLLVSPHEVINDPESHDAARSRSQPRPQRVALLPKRCVRRRPAERHLRRSMGAVNPCSWQLSDFFGFGPEIIEHVSGGSLRIWVGHLLRGLFRGGRIRVGSHQGIRGARELTISTRLFLDPDTTSDEGHRRTRGSRVRIPPSRPNRFIMRAGIRTSRLRSTSDLI